MMVLGGTRFVAGSRVVAMKHAELVDVAELDRGTAEDAAGLLRPSCASTRWIERLVGSRPHGSLGRLAAASDAAIAALGWPDIEEALAAHPRIGDRALRQEPPGQEPPSQEPPGQEPPGQEPPGQDRESSWSRQEQGATANAGPDVQAGLRAGNAEYEQRFGHVFLICATGRSATEMLSALHGRLGNDAAAEREIVRSELVQIVRLRLAKTFR
jgi:2-oxo-4-hydroxy-4-carboxy-5-ureidoimidazoline decarboxylase